ncbi:MAG: transglutaminase family protein [Deltaproteobacteria bacterium]|nr:transglutaminase family protein [Deltaproteobacteria bacterium]
MNPEHWDAVRAHDAAVRALGLELWVGAEPTFTDKGSLDPWWLWEPLGGDKEAKGQALLRALAPRLDGPSEVTCAQGRLYPEEPEPRWCYGALWNRDGSPLEGVSWPLGLEGPKVTPPPWDASQAWLTVTPDPGVVEVNMAPSGELQGFARHTLAVYAAAEEVGLSPLRYQYNGVVTDSGGGGQLTFGGPSAQGSPFFVRPWTLPCLVGYLSRHPSLSYLFAPDCVGSASQGPRPDEGAPERFSELLAVQRWMAWARRQGPPLAPSALWEAYAPLLVDGSGNSHRAELNVEKLWNPHLAERGRLGLVELRALRMQPTPAHAVAVAALYRAVVALAATEHGDPHLARWGDALHDTMALPGALANDLRAVLSELDAHGLGLGALAPLLLETEEPVLRAHLGGSTLTVRRAREFWPLLGDVASQERRGARWVDASAERVELTLEGPPGTDLGALAVHGARVPSTWTERDGVRRASLGVKRRAFVPCPGILSGMTPQDPLTITWALGDALRTWDLHGWIPGGGAYAGLPTEPEEARRRRLERVLERSSPEPLPDREWPLGPHQGTLDVRVPM